MQKFKPTITAIHGTDKGTVSNNSASYAYDNNTETCSSFSASVTAGGSTTSEGYRKFTGFPQLPDWSQIKSANICFDCSSYITSAGVGLGEIGYVKSGTWVQLGDISRAARDIRRYPIAIASASDMDKLTPAIYCRCNPNASKNISSSISIYDVWIELELSSGSSKKSSLML